MRYAKLWVGLAAVILVAFGILGYYGAELYRSAPPVAGRVVVAETGRVLFTGQDIKNGQNVWQSLGGQEVGSVWGHGAYVAPDWSADWLHGESLFLLNRWSQRQHGQDYEQLAPEQQAGLRERLKTELRRNTYDPATGELRISEDRAAAFDAVGAHYASLFGSDPQLLELRKAYAIPTNSIKDPARQQLMNAFFFWASWTCATERPGSTVTYTNNWPAESLIDNKPSSSIVLWSMVSMILLLAGVGAMAWHLAAERRKGEEEQSHQVRQQPAPDRPGAAVVRQ